MRLKKYLHRVDNLSILTEWIFTMFTKSKFLLILSFVVLGLGLSSCETMDGAGRDIESVGDSIQDAAE